MIFSLSNRRFSKKSCCACGAYAPTTTVGTTNNMLERCEITVKGFIYFGLSVVSLGHALTFQSLVKLALANNSNYTNRKGASKPPPNHSVTVCCLGIVFQPSRQSSQPETQSYRIAKRPIRCQWCGRPCDRLWPL
jgi:hypothetical protein